MRRLCIIVLIVCGSLSACSKDRTVLKDTVLKYDALLAEGYRNLNMSPLAQVATEERAKKAYYHMASLGEGGVKMDCKLKDIHFIHVKQSGSQKAEVTTEEKWDYTYVEISSGKPVHDNSATYRLTYALENKSGKWLVADITIQKAEQEKQTIPDVFLRSPKKNPGQDEGPNGPKNK